MVKLVGRRTGVVVDTDDLAQDGAFDSIDAFWAASSQPAWDNDGQDVARQEPERRRSSVSFAGSVDALEALDAYAAAQGITRAEVIRTSVNIGLPMLKLGIALNGQRALTILEHTQLALSLLVERQYPEDSDELIRAAMRNVREHHA